MPHPIAAVDHTQARFHQLHSESTQAVQREVLDGLCASNPRINPKFFYDHLGSTLFTAITQTREYYPTRCEGEIFAEHGAAIARHVGDVGTMIDLGAGDCRKAEALFPLLHPAQYVPVDISIDYLRAAVRRLQTSHPELDIVALGMDFCDRLSLPTDVRSDSRLFFYPGSSIGNLAPEQALPLLQALRQACGNNGSVLIGIDRVKDELVLKRAYDDALGITAAFNLNVLQHVNGMLDSDFNLDHWQHVALYDTARQCVEMHLEARCDTQVRLPAAVRKFGAGERIHTECSYKYTPTQFTELLKRAGFEQIGHWTDQREWFSVFSARP